MNGTITRHGIEKNIYILGKLRPTSKVPAWKYIQKTMPYGGQEWKRRKERRDYDGRIYKPKIQIEFSQLLDNM